VSRLGIYRASLLKSQSVLWVIVVGLGFTVRPTVRDIRIGVMITRVMAVVRG